MSSSYTAKTLARIAAAARRARLLRLLRDDEGVAMIEFAVVLPMMLVVFSVIIEGSRIMLSYESAITGVRDATRYLARTAPFDVCTSGESVAGYSSKLKALVTQGVSPEPMFPSAVTIEAVTPSYRCMTGAYRGGSVPVAQVTAVITISFPFSGIFTLVGGNVPTLTTSVTDQARIFGS